MTEVDRFSKLKFTYSHKNKTQKIIDHTVNKEAG